MAIIIPLILNESSTDLSLVKLKNSNNGKVTWDFLLKDASKIEIDYEMLNGVNEILFATYGAAGWIGVNGNKWVANAPTTANISPVNVTLNKREKVTISNINSSLASTLSSYWDATFSSDIKYYNIKVWNKSNQLIGDYYPGVNTNWINTWYNKVTNKFLNTTVGYLVSYNLTD